MSDKSKIEWTDATWTPIQAVRKDNGKRGVACVKVSPACAHCYAGLFNMRNLPSHGTGLEFTVLNMALVDIVINEEILLQPLRWRRPRKIFACSQTDLFGEFVSDEQIDRVFAVMALCPKHTFQVLTKRPERMQKWFAGYSYSGRYRADCVADAGGSIPGVCYANTDNWPLPNVWLGTTAENQEWADKRIDYLKATPAAKRFLSVEPMLGPVKVDLDGIDWVIAGGESGPGARPMRIEWAESLLEQCRDSGTAFFLKQLGACPIWAGAKSSPIGPARGKCADMAQWPEALRVREFTNA